MAGMGWGTRTGPLSEFAKAHYPIEYLYRYMVAGYGHSCGVSEKEELLCWGPRQGSCDRRNFEESVELKELFSRLYQRNKQKEKNN